MIQTKEAVGGHFTWLGIALIVLGIAAILTPAAAGSAVVVVIGLILLGAGVAAAIRGLQGATAMEKVLGLVVGVVTALAGIAVLAHPLFGLGLLTLLLAGYFMFDGAGKVVVAFRFRPAKGWLWLLISGGVSLLLGVLIWSQWPMSGLWAVGVLVGLNLMSTGFALLMSVSMLREIAARVASRNRVEPAV
jgi:membrane protein HdeD